MGCKLKRYSTLHSLCLLIPHSHHAWWTLSPGAGQLPTCFSNKRYHRICSLSTLRRRVCAKNEKKKLTTASDLCWISFAEATQPLFHTSENPVAPADSGLYRESNTHKKRWLLRAVSFFVLIWRSLLFSVYFTISYMWCTGPREWEDRL